MEAGSAFTAYLMKPLMHKFKAHKVNTSRVHEIVDLAINYLKKDECARKELSLNRVGLLSSVAANYWCNDSSKSEG